MDLERILKMNLNEIADMMKVNRDAQLKENGDAKGVTLGVATSYDDGYTLSIRLMPTEEFFKEELEEE